MLMQTNRSMPSSQVIPELAYPDVAEAAAWLCKAFGFTERLRIGSHRAQLSYGNGAVVVVAASPGSGPGFGIVHSVMVRVENADEHCVQAASAGALIVGPPATYPYGERQYTAQDFAGRHWTFSQTVADVHPSEWGGTLLAGGGNAASP